MIRNNQNRRRRGGNNGPRPQQMNGGGNYGNRLDNRQRGNASQLLEKYRALARDAQQAGDRVTAEYYLQYADHYYRVLGDYREKQPEQARQRGREFYDDDNSGYGANGEDADNGDEDGDDDRSDGRIDARAEDRDDPRGEPRNDPRGEDNRGNWREDRGSRERPARDGNRENAARDGNRENGARDGNRENAARDGNRDSSQREPRRDVDGPRDRQAPMGNRNNNRDPGRDMAAPDASRAPDRAERRERRPEPQRPMETPRALPDAPAMNEGPIPGLPGPATLRVNRTAEAATEVAPTRAARAPRRDPAADPVRDLDPAPASPPIEVEAVAEAPRRRGRPRKVVADLDG